MYCADCWKKYEPVVHVVIVSGPSGVLVLLGVWQWTTGGISSCKGGTM